MFFDVKVLDARGQTKKIVSGQELSKLHWKRFQSKEENKTLTRAKQQEIKNYKKKK